MRKSRLSWAQQERLIEHFVAGTTARTASSLVGVNKNTATFYFGTYILNTLNDRFCKITL
jgi:transposase-like protein